MTGESVTAKLEIVRQNLERLAQIPQSSYEEFASDFRNLDSALHRLQTSIQALIDVASFLVARKGLGTPSTSLEAFEKLEQAALLSSGTMQRAAPIIGFRNRVVHLYERIDAEIVYRILTQHRQDIVELARQLVAALDID